MGGQHHVFRAAERVGDRVQEVVRREDGTDGGCAVKAVADGGVVNGAGLFPGDKTACQTAAVKPGQIQLAS